MGFEQGFAQGLEASRWIYPLIGGILGIFLSLKIISALVSKEPLKNLVSLIIVSVLLFALFVVPKRNFVLKYWEHRNGVPYQEKKIDLNNVPVGFIAIYGFAYTIHTSSLAIIRMVQKEVLSDTLLIKEMSIATQYAKLEDFFRKAFSSPILGDYFAFFYNYYVFPRVHETGGNVDALKDRLRKDMDEPLPITLSDNIPNIDFGDFKAAVGNQVWTQGFFKNSPLASWNGYDYAQLDSMVVHRQLKWSDYVKLLNMVSYFAVWSSYPPGSGDDERAKFIATLKSGWRDLSSQRFFTTILRQYQKYYAQELQKSNDALMEGNAIMQVGDWTIDGIVKLFVFLINWFSKYIAIILKEMYATMYPTLLGLFSFIVALFFPIIFIVSVISMDKEQFVRATTYLFGLALADFVYYSIDTFARFVAEVMGKMDWNALLIPNMEGIVDAIVGNAELYKIIGIDETSRFLAIATVGVMFAIPLSFSLLSRGIDAVMTGALLTYQKALKDASTAATTTVMAGTAVAGAATGAVGGAVGGAIGGATASATGGATAGATSGAAASSAAGTTAGATASATAGATGGATGSATTSAGATVESVRAEIQRQMLSRVRDTTGRRWNPTRDLPSWVMHEIRRQARREFYRAVSEATFGGGYPYRIRGVRGRRYDDRNRYEEITLPDGRTVPMKKLGGNAYSMEGGRTVIESMNNQWHVSTTTVVPGDNGGYQPTSIIITENRLTFADGTVFRRLGDNENPHHNEGVVIIRGQRWASTNPHYINDANRQRIEDFLEIISILRNRNQDNH